MGLIFKKSTAQPAFTVAAAITGTTEATQTLTCAYTVAKARAANVTVRWYRHTADDGTDPAGVLLGTGATYVLTGTDVGNYIRAIVTAINPAGTVQSTTSYTAIITSGDPPTPPTITAAAVITGTADVDGTLTVTATFSGETSVTYQWYSYTTEPTGSPLAGNDEVELGTADTQLLTASEAGRWIVAVVTATNAAGPAVTSASVAMDGVDPYAPIAPTQYSVPAYDDSTLEKIYAYAGDDLQAKINQLSPGKCLVLEAGATWTVNGKITVPESVATGADWVYIISSGLASLPAEGERVSAADATNMPKISVATYTQSGLLNSEAGRNSNSTIAVQYGANKVRFVGLNITTDYADRNGLEYGLLKVGFSADWMDAAYPRSGAVGEEFVLDRCIVSGNPGGNNRDGVVLYQGVKKVAITGCHIDHFDCVGAEAHGIHVFKTPGPTLIHNNRVVAAGINIFMADSFDGTQLGANAIPADVTITKNYIANRLEWDPRDASYAGEPVLSKNAIESKGSKRVLIRGNVIHHIWGDGSQKGSPWFCQNAAGDGVWDVDFRDNLVVDAGTMAAANPLDNGRGYGFQRLRWHNNLFAFPRGSEQSLQSIAIAGLGAPNGFGRYLSITHNTWVYVGNAPSSLMFFIEPTSKPTNLENLLVEDNIFRQGVSNVGVGANGMASGRVVPELHCVGYDFNKNVAVGTSFSQYSTTYDNWRNWASGNTGGIWGNSNVGYVSTAFTELGHFALSGSSQFKNAATDGTDIGADISAIAAQINASDNPLGA